MAQFLTPEGKVLQDLTTRFQVYLERVKNGQIADIDDVIREFTSISERSLGSASLTTQWKVRDVTRGMNTKMRAAAKRYKKKFTKSLNEIADTAAAHEVAAINKLANKKVKKPSKEDLLAAVHESTIQATGTQMEAFVDSWSESAIRRVNKAVSVGAAQGLTNQEIVQQIRGTRANNFRDGILGNATKREADAMVRTATQHAASQAQTQVYRDNDDIIEGYIWISTLDGRTSATCRALDLQQFEIDKGPLPPIHVNCRSSTIPKIEGVDLLSNTTRASADGQVPADMSYYEWLKGQPAEFQDDVLGKTRGKLFREDMTAEEFTDLQLHRNFEPMTIDEMKNAIEPEIEVPTFPPSSFNGMDEGEAIGKWMEDEITSTNYDNMSEGLRESLTNYSTETYQPMNSYLRTGKAEWTESALAEYAANVGVEFEFGLRGEELLDFMDEINDTLKSEISYLSYSLDRSAMVADTTLYRVSGRSKAVNYAVGDFIEDSGFMSWSLDSNTAFGEDTFEHLASKAHRYYFKLDVPAGTNGYLTIGPHLSAMTEFEVLRKGGKFRIVRVERINGRDVYVLEPVGG